MRRPGGGGGGVSVPMHWRPYQMLEKKKRVGRVSKSGVVAERAEHEKGVKNAKNGRKGYPNRYDQSYSHVSIRGKVR